MKEQKAKPLNRQSGKKKTDFLRVWEFLAIFLLAGGVSYAQDIEVQSGIIMIPRTAYVGDTVTLAVPLPSAVKQNAGDIIITGEALSRVLPSGGNIDFHRIAIQRNASGGRLLIEFTAFVPGVLRLPAFKLGEIEFGGLAVTISSVFEAGAFAPELAGAASSLAMPGTALMLYTAMAASVVIILVTIWFIFKGRFYIAVWKEKWKRQRLFITMKQTGKRLRKALQKEGGNRAVLDIISEELREFLSVLTGENCRAMTSREFSCMNAQMAVTDEYGLNFLVNFFRCCDELRFSGIKFNSNDVIRLLNDMQLYLDALEKSKKEKSSSAKASVPQEEAA